MTKPIKDEDELTITLTRKQLRLCIVAIFEVRRKRLGIFNDKDNYDDAYAIAKTIANHTGEAMK